MGLRHFKQMHRDAMLRDRRALGLALEMNADTREDDFQIGNYWESLEEDELIDIARKFLPLMDAFNETLKERLQTGRITVYGYNAKGQVRRIRDPRVIDFDDFVMPESAFREILLNMDGHADEEETCSEDQIAQ